MIQRLSRAAFLLLRITIRSAGLYWLLVIALMGYEERLCFPGGGAYDPKRGVTFEDVWLTASDGVKLHAWFCPCPAETRPAINAAGGNARPVVLFCRGSGGEVSGWSANALPWQESIGADVLIFDYRGCGKSAGTPTEAGLYRDGEAAFDYLVKDRGVDPKQIILVGRSLGGGIAIELASRLPHAALVVEASFTSFPEVAALRYPFVPVNWVMRSRFPSLDRIRNLTGPTVVSHGDKDDFIPMSQGERLFAAAGGPKKFIVHNGLDHFHWVGIEYNHAVRDFLKSGFENAAPAGVADASSGKE